MSYLLEFWTLSMDELAGAAEVGTAEAAVEIVRRRGRFAGSVDHSSSGGTWFRERFMGELVAGLIGAEAVAHLLDRPIDGVTAQGYPSLGWLSQAEIAAALAHAQANEAALTGRDPDEVDLAETILSMLRLALTLGQDVVTIYG